jgi:hypothetical protein
MSAAAGGEDASSKSLPTILTPRSADTSSATLSTSTSTTASAGSITTAVDASKPPVLPLSSSAGATPSGGQISPTSAASSVSRLTGGSSLPLPASHHKLDFSHPPTAAEWQSFFETATAEEAALVSLLSRVFEVALVLFQLSLKLHLYVTPQIKNVNNLRRTEQEVSKRITQLRVSFSSMAVVSDSAALRSTLSSWRIRLLRPARPIPIFRSVWLSPLLLSLLCRVLTLNTHSHERP